MPGLATTPLLLQRRRPRPGNGGGPVTLAGDLLAMTVLGPAPTTDTGFSPNANGFVVALRFKDMARRSPAPIGGDPVFDPSSLTITASDPGFDNAGGVITPVTRTRTVRGTQPLKNPWPQAWSALPADVPAGSWCSNGNNAYYTASAGTKGAAAPTHTTIGQGVANGGVTWVCASTAAVAGFTGYVEAVSGSDVLVYAVVDMPIYAGTTITGVTINAGAYQAGGISSRFGGLVGAAITNGSTLAYEPVQPTYISVPHVRSTGSLAIEAQVDHAWGLHVGAIQTGGVVPTGRQMIAGATFQAWNMARTLSGPVVTVTQSALSQEITTSSPGECAVEVFRSDLDTSTLPAGDAFVEAEFIPWLGTSFRTRFDGEGADWQASRPYAYAGIIARNGANFYYLTTAGTSAASGGPTGTGTAIADGTCVWNFIGSDATKQNSPNIPARWHFYNDPLNVYKIGHCFVDPAGTATGTAGFYADFATANANKGTPANCYATTQAAAAALITYHNTAGGGLTTHNDPGGGNIWLAAGTHSGVGATMAGQAIGSVWLYVRADPNAAPGSVIYQRGAVAIPHRRMWFGDGIASTQGTGSTASMFDPTSDGTAGSAAQVVNELVINGMTYTFTDLLAPIVTRLGLYWLLRSTFPAGLNAIKSNVRAAVGLIAGNSITAGAVGLNIRPTKFIGNTAFGGSGVTGIIQDMQTGTGTPLMFTKIVDNYLVGNTANVGRVLIRLWAGANDTPRLGGTVVGNVIKSGLSGASVEKCWELAADGSSLAVSNVIRAYNTCAGQRANGPYCDVGASNSTLKTQWHERFNVYQTQNMVFDSTAHTGAQNGVSCQVYWSAYGVASGHNCNLRGNESAFSPGSPASYAGLLTTAQILERGGKYLAAASNAAAAAMFVNDTSGIGAQANTKGDFHPAVGAAFVGMTPWQARRFALDGVARKVDGTGAVGALESW